MPIEYTIDESQKVVTTIISGRLTIDEIYDVFKTVRSDERLKSAFYSLVEIKENALLDFNPGDVRTTASLNTSLPEELQPQCEAIVAEGDHAFGLARMFEQLQSDSMTVSVFRNKADALKWLESQIHNDGNQ